MSHATSYSKATCTLHQPFGSFELAAAVCDYIVNHPDECTSGCENADDSYNIKEIQSYLRCEGHQLEINCVTEEPNGDWDLYEFLIHHFAALQASHYMTVVSATFDTSDGLSVDVVYLDRAGNEINAHHILNSYFTHQLQ